MTISAGSDILAADFITASAGAGDSGKVPKLNSSGKLDDTFLKYGGTGADGALSISSGTTNIDCAGAQVVIKNYTSISITGTGKLTFSNPHAKGTTVIIKSVGNITLTSSQTPMIDMSGMGAVGGTNTVSPPETQGGSNGSNGIGIGIFKTNYGAGAPWAGTGVGGASITSYNYYQLLSQHSIKYPQGFVGAGGGSGSLFGNLVTTGAGGRGGGCLIIECAGAWNFTTANGISVAGAVGGNSSGGDADDNAGGGGGGGGGFCMVTYKTLTANSGTINVAGGAGGTGYRSGQGGGGGGGLLAGADNGPGASGGAGGAGTSLVALNTEFA